MGNPFNPYNLETVNYSSTCNGKYSYANLGDS